MNFVRTRAALSVLAAACALSAAGCTIGAEVGPAGDAGAVGVRDVPEPAIAATPTSRADAPRPTPAPEKPALDGRTVYLDPGHAAVMPDPTPMVTDGRGGEKPCQVTGTTANDGWPEHTFNWLMAEEIRPRLEALGATVLVGRPDDTGTADCIDERARKENASEADVVVSLHADGAAEGNRGFHVIAIADPLPGNDADGSGALAANIRDAFVAAGFAPSNYLGDGGIDLRADLTGLNLSTKPKALVEFGNMRDSADITVLGSADGRARMADAVVDGILRPIGTAD